MVPSCLISETGRKRYRSKSQMQRHFDPKMNQTLNKPLFGEKSLLTYGTCFS